MLPKDRCGGVEGIIDRRSLLVEVVSISFSPLYRAFFCSFIIRSIPSIVAVTILVGRQRNIRQLEKRSRSFVLGGDIETIYCLEEPHLKDRLEHVETLNLLPVS